MGKSKKKDSKKKSKKKSKHEDNSLQDILSRGLLKHPQLYSDLPNLLLALDRGKEVVIPDAVGVEDPSHLLLELFDSLPLEKRAGNKWSLGEGSSSVVKNILSRLLKRGSIVQPAELCPSEIISTRAMKSILPLFAEYPSLKTEMIPLLDNYLDGEGVSLNGIDNVTIKDGLVSFFIALGSECLTDEPLEFCDEFVCPSSTTSRRHTLSAVESIQRVLSTGQSCDAGGASLHQRNEEMDATSSSSCSEDGAEDEDGPPPPPLAGAQGPAMPSRQQLAEAQKAMQQYQVSDSRPSVEVGSESESDDDVGPVLVESAGRSFKLPSSSAPIGAGMSLGDDNHSTVPLDATHAKTAANLPAAAEGGREEWMLTPGERKPFGGMTDNLVSNRKFERGKQTKKDAAALAAQREEEYAEYLASEEGQQTEAVLQEYREKRGPTLVDLHRDEGAHKRRKGEKQDTRFFDRDRDLLSHKKMDRSQVEKLIDQAKGLDSRFNKAPVQKSFL